MPYPNSRNDRAWELFVALVAATKAAGANRSGAEKSVGRVLGPFFLESMAREAYIAADAFEKIHGEVAPEEPPSVEGGAGPSHNLEALNEKLETSTGTGASKEMSDAFKNAEPGGAEEPDRLS